MHDAKFSSFKKLSRTVFAVHEGVATAPYQPGPGADLLKGAGYSYLRMHEADHAMHAYHAPSFSTLRKKLCSKQLESLLSKLVVITIRKIDPLAALTGSAFFAGPSGSIL